MNIILFGKPFCLFELPFRSNIFEIHRIVSIPLVFVRNWIEFISNSTTNITREPVCILNLSISMIMLDNSY